MTVEELRRRRDEELAKLIAALVELVEELRR